MTQSDPGRLKGGERHEPITEITPSLPLVSVVVVNYNYGRFLAQAIESVFAQTYPRVECLLVDNASTDESATVIAACLDRHPDLRLHQRLHNGGQSVACLEGLHATSGPYVVFLDADDYLLPCCVERHIQVHLSSRVHVGFTFGDTLQMKGDDVVLSTNEAIATFVRKLGCKRDDHDLLRPTPAGLGCLWATLDRNLPERVRLVSRSQTDWVWSPTSGNCFRRDALDLFCDDVDLESLKSQTDLYLAIGVNAVCGSILIDEPLFAYRLHGENVFSSRPQLAGMLAYDLEKTEGNTRIARSLLLEHFVCKARRFVQDSWQIDCLIGILLRLDMADPEAKAGWQRKSKMLGICVSHFSDFSLVVGKWRTLLFLAGRGLPWVHLWHLSRFGRLSEAKR